MLKWIKMDKVLSQYPACEFADEIKKLLPSELTYEVFYGLFPVYGTVQPSVVKPSVVEEVKVKIDPDEVLTTKKIVEVVKDEQEIDEVKTDSPSPTKNNDEPSSVSPSKADDQWVTIKSRSKKKIQDPSLAKFESLAEQQLSSNKNKKKSIKKKLKEIQDLCKRQAAGEKLDPNQLQKIQNKKNLEKDLSAFS